MGFSAQKPVLRSIDNSRRNRRKTVEKLRKKNISEFEKRNLIRIFLKYQPIENAFSKILYLFRDIDNNKNDA